MLVLAESEREKVFGQLGRILQSLAFQKSPRRRELLTWLVKLAMEGRHDEITQRSVAAAIYGRGEDFDPREDTIVRVEMSRLRAGLEAFYQEAGPDESVLISLPRGSYVPVFRAADGMRSESPVAVVAVQTRAEEKPQRAISGLTVVAYCVTVVAIAVGVWHLFSRPDSQVQPVTELPGRQVQPSVSPDGSRVAFAWDAEGLGDFHIYIKPIHGDSLTPLTSGTEPTRSPAWSPDGRTIAYLQTLPAQNQAVMLVPANGGAPRQLTTIGTNVVGIAWTPDSRNLVVPAGGGDHLLALFLVSAASGERRQLTPGNSYFYPAVSPDGRMLAFATDRQAGRYGAICTLALGPDFFPVGAVQVIQDSIGPQVSWPTWSADGHSLFFIRQGGGKRTLLRVPVTGGKPQLVSEAGTNILFGQETSPGKLLLVAQREWDFLARVPPPNTDSASQAKPVPLFKAPEQGRDGSLSPDGRRIAFSSTCGNQSCFWLANADGSGAVRVEVPAGLNARQPTWSPDGRFVYSSGLPDVGAKQRAQILRIATENRSSHPVAEPIELDNADNMNPRISHDGQRIYFASNRSGTFRIWRAPISGGPPDAISPPDEAWFRPVAEETPDGNDIYYTSTQGIWRLSRKTGVRELYLQVDARGMRVKANGIYYDTPTTVTAGLVLFQPFHPGPPDPHSTPVKYLLGPHLAWSSLPSKDGLLATMVRNESNLVLFTEK